ncbi:riboflavin biosynthesis protein RibD, partial [mine drainage metagenome]
DGRIVGEGWHARAGEAHAEVMALRAAGSDAAGATAYVTLEPCAHHGRTPPCVDALLQAQVARVVFAVADPNPRVNGLGARRLREQGVQVESGLLAPEAHALNEGFFKRMRAGRPWVRVKVAMSLDGRTALANGESRWITGAAAREDVQHWRARSSAILTGVGTVLADDPRLDVRLSEPPSGPRLPLLRVVLDSRLRTPVDARLFALPGEVMLVSARPPPELETAHALRLASLSQRATVVTLQPDPCGRVSLPMTLDLL